MDWTRNLWTKLQSLGFVVFVGIVGCGVALLFLPLMRQRHLMQQEISKLDSEIVHQEQLEKQQKSETESLKTDSAYLERTAREKLNLARPNETIFRFETTPNPAPTPLNRTLSQPRR